MIAYKKDRYFLLGGRSPAGDGIGTWANGKKGDGRFGTWVDAEDGELSRNRIEQGAVDTTIGFDCGPLQPGQPVAVSHWLCMATDRKV